MWMVPIVLSQKSYGAGDHFNAGYCNGLLCGMDIEDCLLAGVGNSGFYIRYARSPTIAEQQNF